MQLATAEHAAATEEATVRRQSPFPALQQAASFIRERWKTALLCSALVLIPCFWHRHIQATDLGSHVYNAWLAQLIRLGQAPGLSIVPQNSNVLFDLMLSGLFRAFGPVASERIAVSVAVLIFFWGGFALCSVAAARPAWSVTPLLAMICYGFMFNMGFFNLYLSVGFSLWAMAILWRGRHFDFFLLAPLAVLIWMSHLLGTGGLLAIGGFLFVARFLSPRWQLVMTASSIAAYFVVLWYVLHHFYILERETDLYWLMGADQLVVFNRAYEFVATAVVTIGVIALVLGLRRERTIGWQRLAVWVQVYAVIAIAVFCAPGGIYHPKLQLMGYLPDRLSLYSAVMMCALLAAVRPAKLQVGLLSAAALVFFALLYRDTGKLDRLETKVAQVVEPLRPPARVVSTFFPSPELRIHEQHAVDRACIGHCFSIANYEPASGQFRIKASTGNRIVEEKHDSIGPWKDGIHQVTADDLPLSAIYACGAGLQEVCLHPLSVGEYNGQAAYNERHGMPLLEKEKVNQ